jgi:hypothetical protein
MKKGSLEVEKEQILALYSSNLCRHKLEGTVNSGNFVSFQTLIGFFLKKSFWYGRPFFFSVDVQNRGLVSVQDVQDVQDRLGRLNFKGITSSPPFFLLAVVPRRLFYTALQ